MSDDHEDLMVDELPEESEDYEDLELEDKLFSDDLDDKSDAGPDAAPPMPRGMRDHVYSQPVNRATMYCIRGPCVHFWALTARYTTVGKEIYLKRIRQCNCHYEETALGGQNIYHCSMWWPIWASFVPESFRGALRPRLDGMYRFVLEHILKYDFSWKTWRDDVFESDREEFRGDSGVGGKRALSKEE